jgi:hypothetical protein
MSGRMGLVRVLVSEPILECTPLLFSFVLDEHLYKLYYPNIVV